MKWKFLSAILILIFGFSIGYGFVTFLGKYDKQDKMYLSVKELANFEYPDDPSSLSPFYGRYNNRACELVYKGNSHFDLIFESKLPHVAKLAFHDVDLSLFIPSVPNWVKGDHNLETITLVDREWNRQQVAFPSDSTQLTIEGGDGYERDHFLSAELSRNCLNAGLWEVLLFTKEDNEKRLLYHGWFNFPLGYYKKVFEKINGLSYWRNWFRLEHWFSPGGKKVRLDKLRSVLREVKVGFENLQNQRLIAEGEQQKKVRLMEANQVLHWKDFAEFSDKVYFATFVPPGYYDAKRKWGNELDRFATLHSVTQRKILSPASDKTLDEVELEFDTTRFIVSGIDLKALPKLDAKEYAKGLYMPMGISVPPFYQSYEALKTHPPTQSPYFALLLDKTDRWLDHHKIGMDGPVMYLDQNDPTLVHLFFLSYERISLVTHFAFRLKPEKDFDSVNPLQNGDEK